MKHKNSPYHVVDSKSYEIGRITVMQETFLIDGQEYPYTYSIHKDSVCVIPVFQNQLVVIRQYRYTIDEWALEFPAGSMEDGETSIEAARRELMEETGFLAQDMAYLGNYYMNEGISSAKCDLYFARCDRRQKPKTDKTEWIQTELVPFGQFEEMVEKNEFKLLIGLAGWMQAKKRHLI